MQARRGQLQALSPAVWGPLLACCEEEEQTPVRVHVDDVSLEWCSLLALADAALQGREEDEAALFTWDTAKQLFLLADKNGMEALCDRMGRRLCKMTAEGGLSTQPGAPSYVLSWLCFAERFQLHELYSVAMDFCTSRLALGLEGLEGHAWDQGSLRCPCPCPCPGHQRVRPTERGEHGLLLESQLLAHLEAHSQPDASASSLAICTCCGMPSDASPTVVSRLLGSAVRQLREVTHSLEAVMAALKAEGLAHDPFQGQVTEAHAL